MRQAVIALLGAVMFSPLAACAQQTNSPNPLAGIPVARHLRGAETVSSSYEFVCDGGRYSVLISEQIGSDPDTRMVDLHAITTPYGEISDEDLEQIRDALRDYWRLDSARLGCVEDGYRLTLQVRGKFEDGTSAIYIDFRRNRVTRIQ